MLWYFAAHSLVAIKQNIRRLLLTFEALSDMGPAMTGEHDFAQTAPLMLTSLMDAIDAREAVLFRFTDKPAMMVSVADKGFASFPTPAVIPLLPLHVYSLSRIASPRRQAQPNWEDYLSANGNVAPALFKCVVPLRVASKLVGMIALGQHKENVPYSEEELNVLGLISHFVALHVHNQNLSETLTQRVTENLKLMATIHDFYDNTLEGFAAAIDSKDVHIHGHSMRVGRYAAAMGEAMGFDHGEVAGLRAAGYLHDIGKITVDKHLFGKPSKLDAAEFNEMADHTKLGHQIVQGIHFPWPQIPEVVRSHHERSDRSGYPDRLHHDETPVPARIVAVADTFDAMTSERPYRHSMSVSNALTEIVKLTPEKYDATAVHSLLVKVRRDSVIASNSQMAPKLSSPTPEKPRFLDDHVRCDMSPTDIDQIASLLQHKISKGRTYLA